MIRIGVMQGRLSPPLPGRLQGFPVETWREEIAAAPVAAVDYIEWIYEGPGEAVNPLASDPGTAELVRLCAAAGVAIPAVCADYFMDFPLVRGAEAELRARESKLSWLIVRCGALGVRRIVIPFVDQSRISDERAFAAVVAVMQRLAGVLERYKVELHLETDLPPADFLALIEACASAWVKVNYDSGNSASLGFDAIAEWSAYGEYVGSVHIKDRRRGGGTVPLGTGAVDFQALRWAMQGAGYVGDVTLQVARGETGDEVNWTRTNAAFVRAWWTKP
jgi:L-ribulose-5-phosphate 3-epimerase